MLKHIAHIGLTVTDLERSINFYQNTLQLTYEGQLLMSGKETKLLFARNNCQAKVAYLKTPGSNTLIELIQFISPAAQPAECDLFKTSVSEICFYTDNLLEEYLRLKNLGVEFISEPQDFDFSSAGFGKSRAVYFKDPDGIILELIQSI